MFELLTWELVKVPKIFSLSSVRKGCQEISQILFYLRFNMSYSLLAPSLIHGFSQSHSIPLIFITLKHPFAHILTQEYVVIPCFCQMKSKFPSSHIHLQGLPSLGHAQHVQLNIHVLLFFFFFFKFTDSLLCVLSLALSPTHNVHPFPLCLYSLTLKLYVELYLNYLQIKQDQNNCLRLLLELNYNISEVHTLASVMYLVLNKCAFPSFFPKIIFLSLDDYSLTKLFL